ncbi:MAG TPA: VOC family protein [Acidobacteriaceae bacterium]|jgi:catechol 2,3-dioxygenase-like lactoylglutathione lyase family enzyme|nr:VOC family protein [Acidobacteriaceae bacterium]
MRPSSRLITTAILFLSSSCLAQTAAPTRPRITGISHVAYYVSDMPKAMVFWHDLLGLDISYDRKKPNSTDTSVAFLKVNDHQYVELLSDPPAQSKNFMSHLCFLTDDVEAMRLYLAAKGIEVPPRAGKTGTGDLVFSVKDPDGTQIEFSQPQPTSVEAQGAGKFLSPTRVSDRIYHAGFVVGNTQRALDFYGNILGFQEFWRGSGSPTQLSWINMRVPDGTDYVELMLYRTLPTSFGSDNHVALLVPDLAAAIASLQSRPAIKSYPQPLGSGHVGHNGKRQLSLFDPDGTRVEMMEPNTADGKPVPSSTAPAPPPSHD